ncbi:hypothetical protein, partial [Heyndrickxia coagulans]|uniref:hypothetical protein n=1 Tax=Heyndrickxia coagulans TaxID=1398 RepID=UPI00214D4C59
KLEEKNKELVKDISTLVKSSKNISNSNDEIKRLHKNQDALYGKMMESETCRTKLEKENE